MLRAISRSPMITTFAPSFDRYSTSASKWARATMSMLGLAARACSTICPASKPLGIATSSSFASFKFAAMQHAMLGGVAGHDFDPLRAQALDNIGRIFDHEQRPALARERLADQLSDPSIADEHSMILERGRQERPPPRARPQGSGAGA